MEREDTTNLSSTSTSSHVNEAFEGDHSFTKELATELVDNEITRISKIENENKRNMKREYKLELQQDDAKKKKKIKNRAETFATTSVDLDENHHHDEDLNARSRSMTASDSLNSTTTTNISIQEASTSSLVSCSDNNNTKTTFVHQSENNNDDNKKNRNEHFVISWHNLDYVVTSNWYDLGSQRKPILNSLSGYFKSGELSAVLGPSGAGKSTLIDCLMGKRDKGLSGKTKVSFLDKRVELERRKRRPLKIATIPQQDHLMDSLTVMETFMFASKIKNAHLIYDDSNNNDNSKKANQDKRRAFDHFANVQRVIQQLNLSSCASLRCGSLSGGQYKRVSIGQELLSRPDLMILDEPTSGLDSVTCYQTIKALRGLIETSPYPMAIVATIHQPDIEVFELFHKAYVLASGGRAIYEGPTGMILDTVKLSLENLEAKRKLQSWNLASSIDSQENLELLKSKLLMSNHQDAKHATKVQNPARLIVELAANEYGYEITNAMNEIQSREIIDPIKILSASAPFELASSLSLSLAAKGHNSLIMTQCVSTTTINTQSESVVDLVPSHSSNTNINVPPSPPKNYYQDEEPGGNSSGKADLDKLLSLVSANVNQRRSFRVYMKHLGLHCHRSWITIVRDPMLFSLQVVLHILVPLLISYAFQGQRGDACPKVGPLDVINEAYRADAGNVLDDLQRELRIVFENLGYMFFQIYVIIFAAVCVTSLTYPLIMHVLLKEYRNGWYSMSSYFIGRTLADLPVPIFNVFLAMGISYHLTGQPLSPYGWRFLSVATITTLATLVAQTQGLMFGALLMNMPQSAVFVAPASTAPLVVVSGFLIRIQSLPYPLQFLSKFSYFTHLLNGFIVSRYGFNRCPCNEEDFAINESHIIPDQTRSLMNLWVDTFAQDYYNNTISNSTTTTPPQIDLVGKLVDTITKAKTFGYEIQQCNQVKPFTMLDYQLNDSDLIDCFIILIAMLFAFRWLTYITLSWKIGGSI